MTSIASTELRNAGLAGSTLTVARRALLRYLRTPQLIVLATIQMCLFFLIYRYMFGGAIHIAGMDYVDFLVPGFIATGVLFSGIGTATAMAEDLEQGFVDRLRSLPIPRSACSPPVRSRTWRSSRGAPCSRPRSRSRSDSGCTARRSTGSPPSGW
jgi:ABC-2 type transport system permease protein